jgi:uncharacterized protein (DUF2147 family)
MKSYRTHIGMPALVAFALLGGTPALANVEGMWIGKGGTAVRIFNCGGAVCGRVASVGRGDDAGRKNADSGQRNHAAVGVEVLISMRPNGPNKWSGRLYNLDDGKFYEGNLIELDSGTIRVEGCWLGICGGENLTRMRSTASSQ